MKSLGPGVSAMHLSELGKTTGAPIEGWGQVSRGRLFWKFRKSTEDLAVKAIKLVCQHYVYLAVLDEAATADGICPFELLADSSGIAWGGSAYQMVSDLTHFKVLMRATERLTPAQQAWAPRTLELYAQLGTKRAAVSCLGQIRAIFMDRSR